MRPLLIKFVLPLCFAALPVLAALLVVATLPAASRDFYRRHLTPLDNIILTLGLGLFFIQTALAFRAMQWRGRGFDETVDPWLNRLSQSSEWFPLLGLIGTVAAIQLTFSDIKGATPPAQIINKYAPALTATGSGLFMALLNILPSWMAIVGRGLILGLGEGPRPSQDGGPT